MPKVNKFISGLYEKNDNNNDNNNDNKNENNNDNKNENKNENGTKKNKLYFFNMKIRQYEN